MSKGDDLQFLTTQDMEDEYNEVHMGGYSVSSSSLPSSHGMKTNIFESEEPDRSWMGKLRKLSMFRDSRHPGAACFHLLFKTLAVLVYELCTLFTSSFVLVCVACILLLAFDFWTVKNVSGRLLVGLRWWNYVKEDGTTEWIFESHEDMSEISNSDRRIFWFGLYAPMIVWTILLITTIISFDAKWLIVVIAALSLSSANIIGYTKCSKEAQARISKFAQGGVAQNIVGAIGVSNIISGIGSMMNQQPQQSGGGQTTMSV
mmetsp:Transcript_19502/g.25263  ORF Transcript_19502/g.25263 Transcript_19502/m.25263 type:complete len:260 (-) Transcript_19502:2440-3219(-)